LKRLILTLLFCFSSLNAVVDDHIVDDFAAKLSKNAYGTVDEKSKIFTTKTLVIAASVIATLFFAYLVYRLYKKDDLDNDSASLKNELEKEIGNLEEKLATQARIAFPNVSPSFATLENLKLKKNASKAEWLKMKEENTDKLKKFYEENVKRRDLLSQLNALLVERKGLQKNLTEIAGEIEKLKDTKRELSHNPKLPQNNERISFKNGQVVEFADTFA
jgi:hypothetical protein